MTTRHPHQQLTRWCDLLAQHLPHLSRPQRRTLALWSFAATITEHIALTTCAAFLAEVTAQAEAALRNRLREFYRPAALKRGSCRTQVDVRLAFGPLLAWVLHLLRPRELVLALDPTLCRDRLVVLTVAVVAHGCALPVAWTALRANVPGAWMPYWPTMLAHLQAVVPKKTRVVVVADRGLQSTELFHEIRALGWHPMMRLTRQGSWRERGQKAWPKLSALPVTPGSYYVGRGHLFTTRPHACTLVVLWRVGFDEPWFLMTDLPPRRCQKAFYGLRCWIEQGFRCAKSGALRCERMRIEDPERAERVWLVVSVSLLWTHVVGVSAAEGERLFDGERRVLGVHRRGWLRVLASLIRGAALVLPQRRVRVAEPIPTLAQLARPPS